MLYDEDGNFAGGMCDGGQGSVHLAEIMVKRTVSVPCISVALLVVLLLCWRPFGGKGTRKTNIARPHCGD